MRSKTMNLQWPARGIVRRESLRSASEGRGAFPTPWAVNCRLEDNLTNRLRGGSFIAQQSSAYVELLAEDGYYLLQEDGYKIVLNEEALERYVFTVTENGDYVVTENGDNIVLGPQYSVATGHGRIWVSAGSDAPSSSTADCYYRARLMRVSENAIFACRQGDTDDWDYGGELEDTGRAMVFQLSEGGEVGGNVVALVPHKDSYLLGFTASETWILAGDPVTGTLRNVSREVGIVGARAWCKNHDIVYFLSEHGLYSVGADGSGLKPLSEDRIPVELTGVEDASAILDYHHPDRGVYIHLSSGVSWFYDTAREGFWAFSLASTDSHVLLGPFRLGEANSYGRVLNINGTVAEGSADVTWRLVPGDSNEQAASNGKAAITAALAGSSYSSYVIAEGTWTAGHNHIRYPRTRAISVVLWLSSTGEWAFETASLTATVSGKWR